MNYVVKIIVIGYLFFNNFDCSHTCSIAPNLSVDHYRKMHALRMNNLFRTLELERERESELSPYPSVGSPVGLGSFSFVAS